MSTQELKYRAVYNWVLDNINSGALKVGEKLPSENELSERFGLSRQTVRHAVDILEQQKLVLRVRGSGTYVGGNGKAERQERSLSSSEQAKIRNQTFGFVMQNYALIDHFSVYKNVELPLKYARKIKSRETRISELLKALNIEDKKNQITNSLSGGQKQRVAIARALVNDAEIILADEPTGALDTKNGIQVMEILSGLHRQGKTIIMVTHNPELLGYCSRTVKIEDGKIISDINI